MARLIFYAIVLILFVRAMMRLWRGVQEGLHGQSAARGARVPQRGVQMVRDPVCGTFVIPEKSLMLLAGREQVYFCSSRCRDAYRARSA
jgi:uncharacterized protein